MVGDFWAVSFGLYTVLIFVTNILALIRGSHITIILIITIFISSLAPFFLFMALYDRAYSVNLYSDHSARFLLGNTIFYLCIILNIFCIVFLDICRWFIRFYVNPTLVEYVLKLKKEGLIDKPQYMTHEIIESIKRHHPELQKTSKYKKSIKRRNKETEGFKIVRQVTRS